ncbi:ABC transporter substrate-binding protein [Octadecabacter sp. G9-8]|uniref:ABC transporter substrate-binding protein n=1 Tax=Octadecabacter dasysiphoniae TaxID=2909341 RepID=A0ABS9CYQ3_9RHOB|nr:ABC transporter substrate-binding protein [Octadecabacter dasysiphoniae]MCF2872036.1 ABC transporter substrate-binding protein [Octadecabacter dasysiphoniae]
MKTLVWATATLFAVTSSALAQDTRTVTDDLGNVVEIPVTPQRIVVSRSDCLATPLIELGAPLIGAGSMQDDRFNNGKPFIRGATALYGTQFDADLVDIGFINQPDPEIIAALEPDLILIAAWAADNYDQLSAIAPTYAAACFDPPLKEWLATLADLVGMTAEHDRLMASYTFKLANTRAVFADRIGDPADVSVVFADPFDEGIYVADDYGTFTVVADDLGLSRITATDLGMLTDNGNLSFELVEELDADFIFSSHQSFFGQPPSHQMEVWRSNVPGFDDLLHAPRNNQLVIVDRSLVRAFAVDGLNTMLAVLTSQIAERDFVPLAE